MKRKSIRKTLATLVLMFILAGLQIAHAEDVFTWYPRLGNVTTNSIEVTYLTSSEADTYVRFALKDDYEAGKGWSGKTAETHGTRFRLMLDGLLANHQYVYQVVVNGKPASAVHSFFTAPEEPIEFTFVAYGDTRDHQEKHKLLADVAAVDPTQPRLAFHVGDLVSNGGQLDLWADYSNAIQMLGASMPYYAAIGNHEYFHRYYYENLALPQTGGGQFNSEWYSFDYAGVHFIVLDTNILDKYVNRDIPDAVEKQYEWIQKDLEAHKETKWIVAVFHHPIYSSHYRSRYPQLQEKLIPIFDQYGVDLVLNGHNHIYERVLRDGRNYITTGAGGAPFDYIWDYEPRVEGSVALEDAILEYVRVKVTADKLYVETVQTHAEQDDFATLKEDLRVIDSVIVEDITPKK